MAFSGTVLVIFRRKLVAVTYVNECEWKCGYTHALSVVALENNQKKTTIAFTLDLPPLYHPRYNSKEQSQKIFCHI